MSPSASGFPPSGMAGATLPVIIKVQPALFAFARLDDFPVIPAFRNGFVSFEIQSAHAYVAAMTACAVGGENGCDIFGKRRRILRLRQ